MELAALLAFEEMICGASSSIPAGSDNGRPYRDARKIILPYNDMRYTLHSND
jgi:hypothetical protein